MIVETSVENRRRKILELLDTDGKVRVSDLSRVFDISEVSVRNDLIAMERAGSLERTHGGAVPAVRAYYNMDFNERKKKNAEEKKRIASTAARLVKDGETVIINSGSTGLYIASELKRIHSLKIITNSIAITAEIGDTACVTLLGGRVNTAYSFTYGADTLVQLRGYSTETVFLCVDGINAETGVTTFHDEEVEVNRIMIERAKRKIIAADYSKIGRKGFAFMFSSDSIDTLITNESADPEELALIESMGIEVIVC